MRALRCRFDAQLPEGQPRVTPTDWRTLRVRLVVAGRPTRLAVLLGRGGRRLVLAWNALATALIAV